MADQVETMKETERGRTRNPLVSFVVPCYNYGRYLADCLSSIFGQEGEHDLEVIVIDDGSTDNTQEVVHAFNDPRLRLITHAVNQGHVATVNEGMYAARGQFIARIDPDDRLRPAFLATLLPKFEAHPEVGLVYGDAALIDEYGRVTVERCDRVHSGRDFKGSEFLPLLEDNFICAPTAIARREAWYAALPIPAHLAFNDWYFTLMMARRWEFYYVDRVVADYRVHAENHHSKVIRDRSEERSIFWLLDKIYAERESDPPLEQAKQRRKARVYGVHYATLGLKYYGFGMNAEARRCYLRAIRCQPHFALSPQVLRRLALTFVSCATRQRVYGRLHALRR